MDGIQVYLVLFFLFIHLFIKLLERVSCVFVWSGKNICFKMSNSSNVVMSFLAKNLFDFGISVVPWTL